MKKLAENSNGRETHLHNRKSAKVENFKETVLIGDGEESATPTAPIALPPSKASQQQQQQQHPRQSLSPFVYWAQTERTISLKVDLRDAKDVKADFTPKSLTFKAFGYGARGDNEYKFNLRFFELINDEESFFRVSGNKIEFQIAKMEAGWWSRLITTPQKPHWLKIDFDRWRSEDDTLDEEKPRDVMQDYEKEYENLQKNEFGYIKENTKKVYLIFYNLAMLVGYLYILVVMGIMYYRDGAESIPKTYESVGNAFKFCQLLQYLGVLHPVFGYTKGGPLFPFLQVSGRNFILFLMIEMEPRMQTKPVVCYVFVIWALVEIFRYPYYIAQLLRNEQGLLTWFRYSVWIPLYPMGIVCEGIIILRNIPYFEETKRLNVEMPNEWNISFDMVIFLKIYLLLLILPGSYFLMTHMATLRAKKLTCVRGGRGRHRQHVD